MKLDLPEILKFISGHNLMLLATVNANNKPQAAVVGFAETNDFDLILYTLKTSRKYHNLLINPAVAAVIGWDQNITVQVEGHAKELATDELTEAQNLYFAKNPKAAKWATNPEMAYFKITPNWLKYTDLNQHPWLIEEHSF